MILRVPRNFFEITTFPTPRSSASVIDLCSSDFEGSESDGSSENVNGEPNCEKIMAEADWVSLVLCNFSLDLVYSISLDQVLMRKCIMCWVT